MKYTVINNSEYNQFLNFEEKNKNGETLIIEITYCECPNISNALPKLWYKSGYIDRVLHTYWSIKTYVTDSEGNCYGKYNPQVIAETHKLNFDWLLEATEENKHLLIEETYNRFMK